MEDIPQNLVDIANRDPTFVTVYHRYTSTMLQMAEFYGMSVQELSASTSLTDDQRKAMSDKLMADQLEQLKPYQDQANKFNSELQAKISGYGTELPNIVRNLNDQLMLAGRREHVGFSEEELYNFLSMHVPELSDLTPPPGPDFIYDPTRDIPVKPPIGTFEQSTLLSRYQDAELEVRMSMIGPTATDADRKRLKLAIQTGNGELLYTEDDDFRDSRAAAIFGISLEDYRRLKEDDIDKKTSKQFKPEEVTAVNKMKGKTIIQTQEFSDSQLMDMYKQELDWELGLNRASPNPIPEDQLTKKLIIKYRKQERAKALAAAENPVKPQLEKPGEYTDEQLQGMMPDRYTELITLFKKQGEEDKVNDPYYSMTDEDYHEVTMQYLRREQRAQEQAEIDARANAPAPAPAPAPGPGGRLLTAREQDEADARAPVPAPVAPAPAPAPAPAS